MNRWGWTALAGMVVAAGLAAAAVRSLKDLFDAIDWDEDPFDDIMDTEDIMSLWADVTADMEIEHFIDPDEALFDGAMPDLLMVGYGIHTEALPAALTGLWKVLMDEPDEQSRTEAIVRAHTLLSQLRVLVAMYEQYTSMGAMERIEEIDDLLPRMHHLLQSMED